MDLPLDELFKRAQNSIHQDSGKTTDIDLIVKETGLPKQFVNYVIESVILHYNAIELLKHMVIFVSEKCKQEGINVNSTITATFLKKIDPICRTHKEDSAFFPDYKEDNRDTSLDFPLLTRFAIVATYCASYNPPVTDQRFFFKKGPRSFEHQRALFIFLFFCKNFDEAFEDFGADFQIDFTSQITHLVDVGLLRVVSAAENLDLPQYLSLCGLDFAKRIARSISDEFKLENYLWDFVSDC
uniref:Origin recognition complex subunit 5 C-terminal domain-containing protein n=1 Tax=Meloidogyne hapla TaxID=6305 RepID=A0A1I8BC28_MELHA